MTTKVSPWRTFCPSFTRKVSIRPGNLPEIRISVASICPCKITGFFFNKIIPINETTITIAKTATKATLKYLLVLSITPKFSIFNSQFSIPQKLLGLSLHLVLVELLRRTADRQQINQGYIILIISQKKSGLHLRQHNLSIDYLRRSSHSLLEGFLPHPDQFPAHLDRRIQSFYIVQGIL